MKWRHRISKNMVTTADIALGAVRTFPSKNIVENTAYILEECGLTSAEIDEEINAVRDTSDR